MFSLNDSMRYMYYSQPTDMRKNYNTLSGHIAMGRRNWLHSGSHEGASNIAFMYSLFESCKLNGLNFGDYLEDILNRIAEGDTDYE